jgi:hypothetical protein
MFFFYFRKYQPVGEPPRWIFDFYTFRTRTSGEVRHETRAGYIDEKIFFMHSPFFLGKERGDA